MRCCRRLALLAGLAAGLSGCCNCLDGPVAGWLLPPAPQIAAVPVFCYETLGDVDCYDRPDPRQRD